MLSLTILVLMFQFKITINLYGFIKIFGIFIIGNGISAILWSLYLLKNIKDI